MVEERVVSGMRPTGALHLGHFHGAIKNWIRLQSEHPCLFFVADWHALTTHYETPEVIEENVWDMVTDWLAAGIDPAQATLFIQSRIPEHAELHLLLSMITPLGWLERVPSYKDQQEKLADRDLSTYGFLGYPLLQAADVLVYRAKYVPVGEDQVPHIEMVREVARRFNHVYGREPGFEDKAKAAAKKLGSRKAKVYMELRTKYQEKGDAEALAEARALLEKQGNLSVADRERLFGYLEGGGRMILVEPEVLLTEASKLPGVDGQKMSKSYNNTLTLREDAESVRKKIRTMPTDPARVKRSDPGDPDKCPVWQLHLVYSDEKTRHWCATSWPTAAKRRASSRGKPCARCARRWGLLTHERAGATCHPDAGGACVQRQGARRALHRSAAGPVHPARRAGSLLRDLRGTARSAALPHPQGEHRHSRHSHGAAHRAVHGVRRGDAHEKSGARRGVPGDGGDADGDQVAHAAAASGDAGRRGRGPESGAGAAPARVREDEARRAEARRPAAARAGSSPGGGVDRADARAAPAPGRGRGPGGGVARASRPGEDEPAPPRHARGAVGARAHEPYPAQTPQRGLRGVRRPVRVHARRAGADRQFPRRARARAREPSRGHAIRALRPHLRETRPCSARVK